MFCTNTMEIKTVKICLFISEGTRVIKNYKKKLWDYQQREALKNKTVENVADDMDSYNIE